MAIKRPLANRTEVANPRVVTPERVIPDGRVVIGDDRIAAVESATVRAGGRSGCASAQRLVLPGLVDLHGDDIERCLFPRPEARVDTGAALTVCDRVNLAAGITTKFHAIAFEQAPDENRSVALARQLVTAVADADLPIDHLAHARCELADPDCVDAVRDELASGRADLLVVDPDPVPTVRRAFVAGTEVYRLGPEDGSPAARS